MLVGLGSNVDRERNVRRAVEALEARFGPLACSAVYETEPVGLDGDPFLNMAVSFESERPAADIEAALKGIEAELGRPGGDAFAPRTIDLDLLLYGEAVIDAPGLRLPRPELTRHAFMLGPASEVAGDMRHPELGHSLAELWAQWGEAGLRRVTGVLKDPADCREGSAPTG